MYRIDNPSAVVNLQAPPIPGIAGYFTGGNPAAGLQATRVDAWWLNQLQEELLTVIDHAGIVPNKADHTQLWQALNMLFTGSGTIGQYLPLTGGQLYRPGPTGSDPLRIQVDAGRSARIDYEVLGGHRWRAGVEANGHFSITDTSGRGLSFDPSVGQLNVNGYLDVIGSFKALGGIGLAANALTINVEYAGGVYRHLKDGSIGFLAAGQGVGTGVVNALQFFVDANRPAGSVMPGSVIDNPVCQMYSDGRLQVGSGGPYGTGRISVSSSITHFGMVMQSTTAGPTNHIGFYNSAGLSVGYIASDDTTTTYATTSDIRLKTDIEPFHDSSSMIDALEPIQFRWKDHALNLQPGFSAQDVRAIYPWAVVEGQGEPGDADFQPWAMDYSKLMPVVIAELKMLRRRLEKLEGG